MIIDVKVTIRSRSGHETQSIFKRHKFHSLHIHIIVGDLGV